MKEQNHCISSRDVLEIEIQSSHFQSEGRGKEFPAFCFGII